MLIFLGAVLAGLQPGGTVRLPPGPHPTIEIDNQNFSPPVTIDARDAVVAGVRITGSTGIIWRGGTIEAPGGMEGNSPKSHGVRLQRARNITFDSVTFTNAKHGMVAGNGVGLTVRNSIFRGLRSDGIDSAGNSDVLIEGNRFTDNKAIPKIGKRGEPGFVDGDHPDAVQIWNTPTTRSVRNIVVRDNFIEGTMQGIGLFGPAMDGYEGIVIENNRIKVTFPTAILLSACTDCRIRYNVVSAAPGARFPVGIKSLESSGLFCENKMVDRPNHRTTAKCGAPAFWADKRLHKDKPAAGQ